jgi:uncharacterized membrane protein
MNFDTFFDRTYLTTDSQYHNQNLLQNQKQRIRAASVDDPTSPTCSLEEFLLQVKTVQGKKYGTSSKLRTLHENLETLQLYASIGDIIVQHQPHITALVWGSARLLLQASLRFIITWLQRSCSSEFWRSRCLNRNFSLMIDCACSQFRSGSNV